MSTPRVGYVADLVRRWVDEEGVQTFVVLVARRGTIVLHEAFGKLTPDPDSPRTPLNALFDTQSLGKVFTATAVMILVEQGRLGLNRPVSGYIPEFAGEGRDAVLVRHLLTHTSGLRQDDVDKFAQEGRGPAVVSETAKNLNPLVGEYFARRYGCPLWKPPGQEMSYFSFGYDMLGEIVRRVSGESLDRFSATRIFGPLGMRDTSFPRPDLPADRRVRRPLDPPTPVDPLDRLAEAGQFCWGSGGALTTALDMAMFGQMFLNRGAYGNVRILSPASVAAMTRDQIPGVSSVWFDLVFREAGWGLGWWMQGNKAGWNGGLQSPETFEHGGSGGVWCWVDPVTEVVGVCFSAIRLPTSLADASTPSWARLARYDLFADAITAAIDEP